MRRLRIRCALFLVSCARCLFRVAGWCAPPPLPDRPIRPAQGRALSPEEMRALNRDGVLYGKGPISRGIGEIHAAMREALRRL